MEYKLTKKELKLKVNWKLSRNEAIVKENFFLSRGEYTCEIAPNIRYGENESIIKKNFSELQTLSNLSEVKSHWCQSFKNAVSNLWLKEKFNGDLSKALNLPAPALIKTSFSIPIMKLSEIESYMKENFGYSFYKIKVDGKNAFDLINEISKYTDKPLRVDANEGFTDLKSYKEFENKLGKFNIQFIEQPFPAKFVKEYKTLKPLSKFEIIADESVLDQYHNEFKDMFHGVNVKLMKTGGLEKAKDILEKAKADNLKTMVGCMIESSLGIYEAAHLHSLCDYLDLDGALLISNDPYKGMIEIS